MFTSQKDLKSPFLAKKEDGQPSNAHSGKGVSAERNDLTRGSKGCQETKKRNAIHDSLPTDENTLEDDSMLEFDGGDMLDQLGTKLKCNMTYDQIEALTLKSD